MKTINSKQIILAAVFALTAGSSLAVNAESMSETVVSSSANQLQTMSVSYADLDTSTAEGLTTLHYRIDRAAEEVCGSSDFRVTGSLRQASDNKACHETAVSGALSQMHTSQLASISE